MNLTKLEALFEEYEKSFNDLDFGSISKIYTDNFISAGPKGTVSQSKQEFLYKAEEASNFYKSVGQKEAKIISKEIIHISNEYCLVTVHWGARFDKTGEEWIMFDVSYIVQEIEDEMKIMLFISHEDEMEAMRKHQLLTENIR